MNKKTLALAGILLIIICAVRIGISGRTYTVTWETGSAGSRVEDFTVTDDENGKVVKITDIWMDGGYMKIRCESVAKGKTIISAMNKNGDGYAEALYVHSFGIITGGTFFGYATGSRIIPIACALYIILILIYLVQKYRKNVKENMYRYRNILQLGLIVYLLFILWNQFHIMGQYRGLTDTIENLMNSAGQFSIIMLPVAFIVSILISISNLRLMMKEGISWRNMLGFILGLLFMGATIVPMIIGDLLQTVTFIDVHNEQGPVHFIEMAVNSSIYTVVAYLECVLIATIILAVKAARHIPDYNIDYMVILGCAIRKDGTPTPLLRSRADRAVEFARMQKEKTGKELVFVPSGGKGSDEVISEAESIKNYLASQGVPEDRILPEDKSKNTYENIRNSMSIIRDDFDGKDPKVGFSTTNYHVFRSGAIASKQGYKLQGIGSRTKSYFWINAFIREYIATLSEERKTHVAVIAAALAVVLLLVGIDFISIII